MKLTGVELRRVQLPLVSPFRTSFGSQSEREVLLVRAVGEDAEGWGECVAMAEPIYNDEYVLGAADVIERFLVPRLCALGELTAETVAETLAPVKGHRMAKAALETAVLDAQLRAADLSFARYLGVTRERCPSGVSVGIMDSLPQLLDAVGGYLAEGYARIKLKIEPGWDVDVVRAVRAEFGDDVPLQVDANAAYTLADAAHLARLDEFGLLLVEQPLADDDLRQHAELARVLRTPICLDESVVDATSAADALALGSCRSVNIKPGRVGGYLEARRIHDLCRASGAAVWCGGMLETGIGRTANIVLAGLPGFTLTGDVSGSDRFYREDITEPVVMREGWVEVSTAPGVGALPLPERLAETTVWQHWIPA